MELPAIRYYAMLSETTGIGKKTPKYTVVRSWGRFAPMEALKGRDGKISMYLTEKLKEGLFVPSVRLQAKGSLNFTGLKEWFLPNGKLSGFAYGYPLADQFYSKDRKPNPFYAYRNDGYLFRVQLNDEASKPVSIELLVLANAKPLISSYCKVLQMGGFDEALQLLRSQAEDTTVL